MTVLVFYLSDVWCNVWSDACLKPKPMFVLDEREFTLTNVPVPRVRPSLPAPTLEPVDMTVAQSLNTWLRHHSLLCLLVRDRLLYFPIDRHWTPEAVRLVADLLYAHIKRHYLSANGTQREREISCHAGTAYGGQ